MSDTSDTEERWRPIADRIVRDRWGDEARLGATEGLGGSSRSFVHRVALEGPGPESVVVKQAKPYEGQVYDPDSGKGPAYGLMNDWGGLAFLDEVAPDGPWPAFYGGDRDSGVIVLEDLGAAKQIDHVLLGEDAGAAEAALFAYVRALASLHCASAGRTDRYHEIRGALGPRQIRTYAGRVADFEKALSERGIQSGALSAELERCTETLASPGPFLVYTHGDSCPDNCLIKDDQVWLLDFEWGEVRHALIDGCFPWIHFPSCWCVNRLPDTLPDRLLAAYRTALSEGIPAAGDDVLFGNSLVATSVSGFANNFDVDVSKEDRKWGISTLRQRNRMRIRILARTADDHGFPALADASSRLGDQLDDVWSDVEPMPIYPAFRSPEEQP